MLKLPNAQRQRLWGCAVLAGQQSRCRGLQEPVCVVCVCMCVLCVYMCVCVCRWVGGCGEGDAGESAVPLVSYEFVCMCTHLGLCVFVCVFLYV